MKAVLADDTVDSRAELMKLLKPYLDGVEVFGSRVLMAIYIRPEKTKSNLYLPPQTTKEDVYQGKAGLIVKLGPTALAEDVLDQWTKPIAVGDWVVFNVQDTRRILVGSVECRLIDADLIHARVESPDWVY